MGKRSRRDLVSVDGQIVLALAAGPLQASEIYENVTASQPTVSRRLGWLLRQGVVNMKHAPDDRRCNIYALNPVSMWQGLGNDVIRQFHALASLIGSELSLEKDSRARSQKILDPVAETSPQP